MTHITDDTCYSGGADGSDLAWEKYALRSGHKCVHYVFVDHKQRNNPNAIVLLENDLKLADPDLKRIKHDLHRQFPSSRPYINNLLRRNFWIARMSKSLYAVTKIKKNGLPDGGSAWAIKLFTEKSDRCYCLNTENNIWYKWKQRKDDGWFVLLDGLPPRPQGLYGGIGTRDISKVQEEKIGELYVQETD